MTLVWASSFSTQVSDPDAQAYIEAVETQDTQPLEVGVAHAINTFVLGCKADGIWDAIKASCILAGARTLSGALVPLKGTAPTKNGTEGGWNYNRETGLQGNGTDNYLDSGRDNSAESQDDKHVSTYMSTHYTRDATRCAIGMGFSQSGCTHLVATTSARFPRVNSVNVSSISEASALAGLEGASRNSSTTVNYRYAQVTTSYSSNSQIPASGNILVFARGSAGSASSFANARIAFYSIGESLDLALLDNRVSTLMTDIGAAIP